MMYNCWKICILRDGIVMKLLLIEGISGVGKSTMTPKICKKLCEMGFSVNCYVEGDISNPIDFYCTAYFKQDDYAKLLVKYPIYSEDIENNTVIAGNIRLIRYRNNNVALFPEPLLSLLRKHEFFYKTDNPVPLSEYSRVYKTVWAQLAKNANIRYDFMLFDGSLLHHPINDLIQNYNASYDEIVCHINSLLESVDLCNPQIIYFSSENVAERLHKAHISRNQAPPSFDVINFWEERKQMDLAVMQKLSIPYEIYDISQENWDKHLYTIINNISFEDSVKSVLDTIRE